MGLKSRLKVVIDHSGLNYYQTVGDADIQDLVHPGQVKNNASLCRDGVTAKAGTGPPWDNRDLLSIGQAENFGHLFCRGSPENAIGPIVIGGGVVRIGD